MFLGCRIILYCVVDVCILFLVSWLMCDDCCRCVLLCYVVIVCDCVWLCVVDVCWLRCEVCCCWLLWFVGVCG